MQRRYFRIGLITLLLIQILPGRSYSLQDRKWQRILIETRKPYDGIVRKIEAEGGRVTQTFKYVDGIAADVPEDVVPLISSLPEVQSISKDEPVEKPANVNPIRSHSAGQAQQDRISNRFVKPAEPHSAGGFEEPGNHSAPTRTPSTILEHVLSVCMQVVSQARELLSPSSIPASARDSRWRRTPTSEVSTL